MYTFKDFTTLKIGGPVSDLITTQTPEQLSEALRKLPAESNFLIVGGGSNLLVSDSGFDGVIIKNEITGIEKNGNKLIVKSGTKLQELVDFANQNGLKGLESLAGIPGTVGGAIYGNAGAYGQTISDHITQIQALNPVSYQTLSISKDEARFSYRFSVFKKNHFLILEAVFALEPGNASELKQISEETIKKREVKYPPGIKCPGSFFKNIPAETLAPEILQQIPKEFVLYNKVSAGALLESVGAKGAKLGQILIAPYHANLFINQGNGTALDFYNLAKEYQQKVFGKYGIKLEPEVQLINLPSLN